MSAASPQDGLSGSTDLLLNDEVAEIQTRRRDGDWTASLADPKT